MKQNLNSQHILLTRVLLISSFAPAEHQSIRKSCKKGISVNSQVFLHQSAAYGCKINDEKSRKADGMAFIENEEPSGTRGILKTIHNFLSA
jgi:hypothetical protein